MLAPVPAKPTRRCTLFLFLLQFLVSLCSCSFIFFWDFFCFFTRFLSSAMQIPSLGERRQTESQRGEEEVGEASAKTWQQDGRKGDHVITADSIMGTRNPCRPDGSVCLASMELSVDFPSVSSYAASVCHHRTLCRDSSDGCDRTGRK